MSIASRIESIENHLSNDYTEIARLGADLTNVDKNIENIAEAVREAYSKMPKVLGVGSNLSLSPTLKGGLDITPIGKCEQDTYSGKNLFSSEMEYGTIDNSTGQPGTASTSQIRTKDYIKVTPSTQYTISNNNNYSQYTYEYDENYNFIKLNSTNTKPPFTLTVGATTEYIKVRTVASGNENDLTTKFMLNTGSSAENWEPYVGGIPSPSPSFPQSVRVVTGDNDVVVQNKNLTLSKIANVYLGSNGAFSNSNDYDTWIAQVTQGETYTVTTDDSNLVLGYYTSMPTRYSVTYNNSRVVQLSKTFTAEITGYVSFRTLIDYSTPQLELGSTATEYVAHAEQKVTLHLGSNYLAGIDTYDDEIVGKTDEWKIVREVKKEVFTGAENEYWYLRNETAVQFNIAKSNSASVSPICNRLFGKVNYSALDKPYIRAKDGFIWLDLGEGILSETTVSALRTWLSTYNLEVYYVLATPTEEPITDTTLISDLNNMYNLMGYDGQTNITITSNSSNAQMTASVSALKGE